MECVPPVRLGVTSWAIAKPGPPAPNGMVPRVVPPSLKVTVPVGEGPDPVTVARKVTELPYVEGLGEDVTTVVVGALVTTWVRTGEVLPVKLASPPKTAMI